MSGATTAAVANILQTKYLPGLIRQFNSDTPNLRYIRQNSSTVDAQGDHAEVAIELGVNEGGGFHGESADVPDSGYPAIKKVSISLKQMTFRARITYKLMRKARTNANAFARGAQLQMQATREGFTMTANQYLWGDGTGVQARVVSWNAGTRKLVLDRAYALADGGSPESIIRRGQTLHLLDTATYQDGVTADRGKGIVEDVNMDTGTAGQVEVTIKAGHTLAGVLANDYVFLQNTIKGWIDAGETEDNSPAMGLLGFYDHALVDELQGLSATTEGAWRAEKIPLTEGKAVRGLRRAKNRLAKRGGADKTRVLYLISSYEAHERIAVELDDKLEFRNMTRLDAGWDMATFDGRPWFMDHTAPDGRIFFVPTNHMIERFAVDDFINFIDEGGGPLQRVPNKTVFDALLSAVYNYGIKRRNILVSATGVNWSIDD